MALPPRDHRISLAAAAALTKRHRDAKTTAINAGAFHMDQVLELLNQPGCVGLRIYHGRDEAGQPTLILTGVDQAADDLTGGTILEFQFPCPPYCSPANPLNT